MTKCKILECQNEAEAPYPCCSQSHGTSLWMIKNNIKYAFDADMDRAVNGRGSHTIEEAAYYMSL